MLVKGSIAGAVGPSNPAVRGVRASEPGAASVADPLKSRKYLRARARPLDACSSGFAESAKGLRGDVEEMTMGGTGPFRLGGRDREAADTSAASGTGQASRLDAVPFAVDHREVDGGIGLVTVEGELDLSSAPNLKWALADTLGSGARQIVVDLSHVTFIDSTALGVLVGVRRDARPRRAHRDRRLRRGRDEHLRADGPRLDFRHVRERTGSARMDTGERGCGWLMASGASALRLLRRSAADMAAVVVIGRLDPRSLRSSRRDREARRRPSEHEHRARAAEPAVGQGPAPAATPGCCAQPRIQAAVPKHRRASTGAATPAPAPAARRGRGARRSRHAGQAESGRRGTRPQAPRARTRRGRSDRTAPRRRSRPRSGRRRGERRRSRIGGARPRTSATPPFERIRQGARRRNAAHAPAASRDRARAKRDSRRAAGACEHGGAAASCDARSEHALCHRNTPHGGRRKIVPQHRLHAPPARRVRPAARRCPRRRGSRCCRG